MRQSSLFIVGLALGAIQFQLLASAQPERGRSPWINAVVPGGDVTVEHGAFPTVLGSYTHPGVDIGGGCDLPVILPTNGMVVRRYFDDDGMEDFVGNGVLVEHGSGLSRTGKEPIYTAYFHLKDPPTVDEGPALRGHQVGQTGATGVARGCHLHFEVRKFSETLNPQVENIYLSGDQRNSELLIEDWIDPEAWVSEEAQSFWTVQPEPTFVVERGQEKNGFVLSNKGEAFYLGQSLGQPILSADQAVLHTYVSKDGAFAFVMQVDKYFGGLYGALVNLRNRRVIVKDAFNTFDYWGKYGSPSGVSWSPSGEWAAILVPYRDGQGAYILFSFLDGSSELILPGGSLASLDRWESNFTPRWWGSLSWLRSFGDVLEYGFGISEGCHYDDEKCYEANSYFELTKKLLRTNSTVSPQPDAGRAETAPDAAQAASIGTIKARAAALAANLTSLSQAERDAVITLAETILTNIETGLLADRLIGFGLTPATVSGIIETKLKEAFLSSAKSLTVSVIWELGTDVISASFATIIMESKFAEGLPQNLKAPLHALLEATMAETLGFAKTAVVDAGTVGPFAVFFPILDRIEDVIEIYEQSHFLAAERTAGLFAVALGAEINADLNAMHPGPKTNDIIKAWKRDTLDHLQSGYTQEDYLELREILEIGYTGLKWQKLGYSEDSGKQEVRALIGLKGQSGRLANSGDNPIDGLVKLISGQNPRADLIDAFLSSTAMKVLVSEAEYPLGNWHDAPHPNIKLQRGESYQGIRFTEDGNAYVSNRLLETSWNTGDSELHLYFSPSRAFTFIVMRDGDKGGYLAGSISKFQPFKKLNALRSDWQDRDESRECAVLGDGIAWSPDEATVAFNCIQMEGTAEAGFFQQVRGRSYLYRPDWANRTFPYANKKDGAFWVAWRPDFRSVESGGEHQIDIDFERYKCPDSISNGECWGAWEPTAYRRTEKFSLPR